jgi:predicted acetyltransferase
MPELTRPTIRVQASFLAAMDELRADGQGGPGDESTAGREIREYGSLWHQPEGFASYIQDLRNQETEEHARQAGRVPETTLWWVSSDDYLGRIAIRHRLTESLREWGGHIGYDVRPSAQRRGHGTTMLAAALPEARALAIDPALLTCDESNTGSRRIIETNGGELEDNRDGRLRYWVPTS